MTNGDVIISGSGEFYAVKVSGRATFECVAPLRTLSKQLDTADFKKVDIDLAECQGMDSTFMGVLAMMALRAKKIGAVISIYNANDLNRNLLYGLGLKRLFQFTEGTVDVSAPAAEAPQPVDRITHATTVLEAHKTLMDVDQSNVGKFEKVVDYVQKDLDRLNEKSE